jgi:hypothetical protein
MNTQDLQVVDMIERANDAEPFCACGRHTTPIERQGIVWLECASLSDGHDGRLARLLAALTAPALTHIAIVDGPASQPERVLASQTEAIANVGVGLREWRSQLRGCCARRS